MRKLKRVGGLVLLLWGAIRFIPDLLESIQATAKYGKWFYKHLSAPHSELLTAVIFIVGMALVFSETVQKHGRQWMAGGTRKLDIRFNADTEPYRFVDPSHSETSYRFEVYNEGSETAQNVRAWLKKITPRPLAGVFPANYPYPVRLAHQDDTFSIDLNPKDRAYFEIVEYWTASHGGVTVNKIDTKRKGNASWFSIQENECWLMEYEVTCAQMEPQPVSFELKREGQQLVVSRV